MAGDYPYPTAGHSVPVPIGGDTSPGQGDAPRNTPPRSMPRSLTPHRDLPPSLGGSRLGSFLAMSRLRQPAEPTEDELRQMTQDDLMQQIELRYQEGARKDLRIRELEAEVLKYTTQLAHVISSSLAGVEAGEDRQRKALEVVEVDQRLEIHGQLQIRLGGTKSPEPEVMLGDRTKSWKGFQRTGSRKGSAFLSASGTGAASTPSPGHAGTAHYRPAQGAVSIQGASGITEHIDDIPQSPAWMNTDRVRGAVGSDTEGDAESPTPAGPTAVPSAGAALPQEYWLAKRPDKDFGTCQYDPGESMVHRRFQEMRRTASVWVRGTGLFRWLLAFLIGVCTASVAFFINYFTKKIFDWKFDWLITMIRDCDNCKWEPFGYYALANAGLTLVAALFVFVCPIAAGSGIPEIKCFLNGVKIPGVLRLQSLVAKSLGVLFSVAAGLPCGKEGPMIHSGAIVAAGISQGQTRQLGFSILEGPYQDLRNDYEKRDFVSCGAAAGVAAAFGAPVGGLLFAIEEGCSFWKPELIWRIFFSSIVSAFSMAFLTAQEDRQQALNAPGMIDFGDFSSGTVPWKSDEVPLFIVMGVVGGLLGGIFIRTNMVITRQRTRGALALDRFLQRRSAAAAEREAQRREAARQPLLSTSKRRSTGGGISEPPMREEQGLAEESDDEPPIVTCWDKLRPAPGTAAESGFAWRGVRVLEAIAVSLIVSASAFFCMGVLEQNCVDNPCPEGSGSGPDCGGGHNAADEVDDWRHVYCGLNSTQMHNETIRDRQLNQWATLWLNPLAATLRTLFHTQASFSSLVLLGFCVIFWFTAVINYGTGVPSGLFVPSLVCGATYGRLFGLLLQKTNEYEHIDIGTYSLVGAASFLGGVCRITFSLTVILIEATRDIAFALPLMIAIMSAKFTGDFLSKGIYDEHIEYRKVPFLEAGVPLDLRVGQRGARELTLEDLLISDVMSPPPARPRVGVRLRCMSHSVGRLGGAARRTVDERPCRGRRWAVICAIPGEQRRYITLHYDGDEEPVTVSRQWWEQEARPEYPRDREKPKQLLMLPPVCRARRILEVLREEVCGFPVVAGLQVDELSTGEAAEAGTHDGLITRMQLFVLLGARSHPGTPTFSATRKVRLTPRDKLGIRVLLPADLWDALHPVINGHRRAGWVHSRDTGELLGGVTCRRVYWTEQCDMLRSISVPVKWLDDAPVDQSMVLPYESFLCRYPQKDKPYDAIRSGKERLGLHRLHHITEDISRESIDGVPMGDAYVDLRPYMNEQPYVVPDNFSFVRAYTLFRAIGMRHMLVVDEHHRIQGIVTRSDLYKTVHVAEALHHGHKVPLQYAADDDCEPATEKEIVF
eukprot:TRINITY_DN4502_c0_g1_i1.p1 TRINITY_DN4502_c0_g1~~TRINITY_DN4502_c0_g1_i1.p1  ORF type:complete len:1369 (+),score=417.25 TRINITY_DN4502_c0_g1_i1:90-4109(+)